MFKSVVHQSRGSGGGAGLGACLVENVDSSDAPHPKSNYVPTLSPSSIGLCQTVVHLSPNNHLNNDHHQNEDHFISDNQGFFTSKFTYYTLVLILTFGITMLIIVPLGSTFLFIDYQQQLAQRKFNKSDFCKSKCQYGAECIVDEYTNQAYCRCPLSCPDDYQPVCGSDKITYINQCHLNYESCNKQQIIQIISNGTCDSVLCRNVTCQKNYQKCQVDENGLAQCVCSWQSICHNHHHNHNGVVNKEQGQVCGSNGKLYNSECEMYKYSCQHKQDIVSVDRRFCSKAKDPLDIRNSFSAATHKNQNNGIGGDDDGGNEDDDDEDEDDGDNSSRRKIVCGDQICHRYATCHHPSLPQQQQTVPLSTSLGPSRLTTMPTCQCLNNCSRYNNNEENSLVVCATNNRNYANECEMKQDACQRQLDLKVLHKGQCGQCDPPCKFYSKCQLNNMIPECACPQVCLRVDEPVCGDNGVTYENECELRVASCRIKKQINVQFNASCDLCHNIVCHHGATCFNGECLCTDNCQNNIVEPLCANDGNTYRNECEMNRMACNSKKELIACEETSENYFAEEFSSLIQTENTDNYEAAVPSNTIDDLNTIVGRQTSHCDQKLQAEVEVCRDLEQKYSDKEESYVYICENRIFKSKCEMIKYGCHNQTRLTNCSKYCHCYKNGIQMNSNFVATICDGSRSQCSCKEGFRGSNCDQCASKFWRHLNHLNSSLIIDCKPCMCNRMGSLSEECEDSRGKCKCKPGIKGHKCDRCPPNMNLTYHGCVETESSSLSNDVCSRKRCKNGAVCRVQQKQAVCVCQFNCNKVSVHHHHMHVCASDGSIHKSMCHFRQYACESQKKLQILRQCPS